MIVAFLWATCLFFCRSLTKSTTPHGIASSGGTLAATWRTRQNTSFISTWAKWPFYSSSQDEMQTRLPDTSFIQPILFFAATSKKTCATYSRTAMFSVIHGLKISTLWWIGIYGYCVLPLCISYAFVSRITYFFMWFLVRNGQFLLIYILCGLILTKNAQLLL